MIVEVSGFVGKKYKEVAVFVAGETNKFMRQPDSLSVSIAFVSKCKIKKLNKQLRGVDRVTDVLSFPSFNLKPNEIIDLNSVEAQMLMEESGDVHFGDIAICMSKIRKQAKEYQVKTSQELKKIVIHSMLHLMGYDHIEDSDYKIMHKQENLLDKKINIEG